MCLVRVPEHRSAGDDALKLLARFGMVGIASTILYAALVTAFIGTARCHPIQPSLGAYAAATLYSYLAYRSLTFVSGPSHRTEAPRFPAILDALR
ncbi:hypothetical protein EOD12_05715 [Mesorhizobium sp. M7A.T.Ca.TU.009.02.1.1]|uniref:GtrA family protein n=2 Tax=Mesorhizobium TaxID=68287 RepID=UPI000FCBE060|nr:hypothetical protein EOD15_31840 [Mesorhizobium sp. M7A.T.Ca.US.000.02.2.1]RUT89226.1 hypothetical protein EOD14_03600 [Mesorhizobium sp. M7A.T.Ca.US.000.02.1.1]RUU04789.1 hypothetical protein EOD12_05715 [Mesorhizobium sp. M7A.T.Ca.TU.009.02.1.1]RUU67473.1 hypothetical protein EOC99_02845 [Mesorhizobium sp. M7A.T.Ca.TU.009.01.1.1]RUU90563.1 hypothetical protein EOD03_01250 [Mesorhizobium sp. M7A.T.Ca.TU.009.01.1.2]RWO38696.1 MAG: hypothetical protein EOS12_30075 [Mesorhizobium sp.]